jgi:hypothetical protein
VKRVRIQEVHDTKVIYRKVTFLIQIDIKDSEESIELKGLEEKAVIVKFIIQLLIILQQYYKLSNIVHTVQPDKVVRYPFN